MTVNKFHIVCILLSAALLLPGCKKDLSVSDGGISLSKVPVRFTSPSVESKAPLNISMGPTYNTAEDFIAYAAYSPSPFDPSVPSSYEPYWTGGQRCTYNSSYGSTLGAWAPEGQFFFPLAGYLNFRAYSPADGAAPTSFSWADGFTWNDFTVPAAGSQYDLLYSDLVRDCQQSDYTTDDEGGYDDDSDLTGNVYNGIDLSFHHALSLVEVQAVSALGSYSTIKYYVQKVVLHKVYNKGDFASSTGTWTDIDTENPVDYTLLDLSGEVDPTDQWKKLPGSDQYPVSIHPDKTLLLLPQTLDRDGDPLTYASDAYLEVVYKCSTDNVSQTTHVSLPDVWERGKKYTYKLVFSAYIEFVAEISAWDEDITYGNHVIVQ